MTGGGLLSRGDGGVWMFEIAPPPGLPRRACGGLAMTGVLGFGGRRMF